MRSFFLIAAVITCSASLSVSALNFDAAFAKEEKRFHSYHQPIAESLRPIVGYAEMQGKRPTMEDTLCIRESTDGRYQVFGVFDGHGGEKTALFIADELPTRLLKGLGTAEYSEQLIVDLWKELDDACLGLNDGCAAVVALVDTEQQKMYLINLGDSRGLVLGPSGTVVAATEDHKPNDPAEKKRIEEAGGFVAYHGCWRVDGRLALARSFGDFALKPLRANPAEGRDYHVGNVPDITEIDLATTNVSSLILACDGVWDELSNEQIARLVDKSVLLSQEFKRHPQEFKCHPGLSGILKDVAQLLVCTAYKCGSTDNISALIVAL